MNKLFKQFTKSAFKRGYSEDDAQEAVYLILKRYKSFMDYDPPLQLTMLIRALSEARKNNEPNFRRVAGRSTVDDTVDIDLEYNQPSYRPQINVENLLDKYIKRANISNEQMQLLQAHLSGQENLWIAEVFGIHKNSVTNKLNSIRDKLQAVHLNCYV